MFNKCCKCCDKNKKAKANEELIENILGANVPTSKEEYNTSIPTKIKDNKMKNRTEPMIYKIEDVLDF